MHTRFLRFVAIALVALAAFACGGVSNPSTNTTDTFMAIVQPGGAPGTKPFTASKSGEISVTITSINPTFNGFLTIAWLGAGCSGVIQANQFAMVGTAAISGPIQQGNYCIGVFDSGFVVPEQYTVSISHP